jgi:hypothetical protein
MTSEELFVVLIRITGLWIILYGARFLVAALWYLFYVPPTGKDLENAKREPNQKEPLAYFYWGPVFVFGGWALMKLAPNIASYFK